MASFTKRISSTFVAALVAVLAVGCAVGVAAPPAGAIINGNHERLGISASIANITSSGCTGTLIHPEWVLTAWHCAHASNPRMAQLTIGDDPFVHSATASRIGPDDPFFFNDIALLHLDVPSRQPVLPLASSADRATFEAAEGESLYALAVGWGYMSCTKFTVDGECVEGAGPEEVQAASVLVNHLPETDPNRNKKIEVSEGSGYVCDGDSGSPLLVSDQYGRHAVAGVLSQANCKEKWGRYVRVADGVDRTWINAQLRAPHGTLDFDGDGAADVLSSSLTTDRGFQAAYSSGGASSWISLGTSPQGPDSLRFGDFDGDGVTDLFTATRLQGGYYRYKYAPGGHGPWVSLAMDVTPLRDLRFGDFDGDGRTDLFNAVPRSIGVYEWRYSPGGAGNWVSMHWDSVNPSQLRFGDFDGDGRTDVFHAAPRPDGGYRWRYVSGGSNLQYWTNLAYDYTAPADLRFGDFDGDSRTDVFTAVPDGSDFRWQFSSGGETSWQLLGYRGHALADLRFGDFDGDAVTDVFTAVASEGGYQWQYSRSGFGLWRPLAWSYESLSSLRVGDLYGQG